MYLMPSDSELVEGEGEGEGEEMKGKVARAWFESEF